MSGWAIFGIVAGTAAVAAAVAAVVTRCRDIRKVAYMMDALEDGELNFRFRESNRLNRTLNRIRTIFERQRTAYEQDSWSKLIRVLTHEIMNTAAPIASLSEALSQSMDEEGRSELDVRAGLETIADSSKNLIKFVQTYRQLSGVARPVRRQLVMRDWLEKVVALNSEYLASFGATCTCRTTRPTLTFYADEGQITQILINLIRNALQAGARQIGIEGASDLEDEVTLTVTNDGEPIPQQSRDQIFVPFFTTKPEGSGIGLSISRQIMRQHNGSIDLLKSDPSGTVFVLRFR